MELCSIEDAFPNIENGSVHKALTGSSGFPYVGGTDSKASREERRAARKKAKKMKGPALAFSNSVAPDLPTDPDRPAMKRLAPVETVQEERENFVAPVLPKASCLFSDAGTPSYFGKDVDDTEEGFTTFSAVGSDNPNFMISPEGDPVRTFDLKGVNKAAGVLPETNLNDVWKPMSPAASYTAFLSSDSAAAPGWSMNAEHPAAQVASKGIIPDEIHGKVGKGEQNDMLMGRINELVNRLETLEKKKSQDSQTEILMFVGTGVFLLLSFELLTRR